jgi:hypothetical protein
MWEEQKVSCFNAVLPANSVHVGWSSYAAMWIRGIPALIPGHFAFQHSTGAVRAAWERQGAEDWETFLSLRARELRLGGCLVVSVPGADENGASAFERIFDLANAELVAMINEGAITAEERCRMALNVWPRRMSDLVAPFAVGGRFQSLVLKATETCLLNDSAWACYEKDGDADALANKHAMFFRSVFTPTLASFLDAVRAGEPTSIARFR